MTLVFVLHGTPELACELEEEVDHRRDLTSCSLRGTSSTDPLRTLGLMME